MQRFEENEFEDLFDLGHRIRDLLEDFELIGNMSLAALTLQRYLSIMANRGQFLPAVR